MFLITTVGFNIYAYNKIVKRSLFVFDKDTSLHLIMNHKIQSCNSLLLKIVCFTKYFAENQWKKI